MTGIKPFSVALATTLLLLSNLASAASSYSPNEREEHSITLFNTQLDTSYYAVGTAFTQLYRYDMAKALSFASSEIPAEYRQVANNVRDTDKDRINAALGFGRRFGSDWAVELVYYSGISAQSQWLPSLTPRDQRELGLTKLDFDYLELSALRYLAISERVLGFGRIGAQWAYGDVWYRDNERQRSYADPDETRNFRKASIQSLEGVAGAGVELRFNNRLGMRLGYNFSSMGWRQSYAHFYVNF